LSPEKADERWWPKHLGMWKATAICTKMASTDRHLRGHVRKPREIPERSF